VTAFRDLHRPGDPFILANAWDAGSAKMLVALGAQAVATSSAAHAFTLGRPDGTVTRDEALAHAQALVAAVNVPVSGDFENGFGDEPETCAETVRLAAEAGLAGISIEDVIPADTSRAYDAALAAERIRAAASAARALPRDFVLFARADGVMTGAYGMDEALARVRAFDEAGADGLYVPVPPSPEALGDVCRATAKPVNALAVGPLAKLSRAQLGALGVARISLGSALARAVQATIAGVATDMFENGNFQGLLGGISGAKVDEMLARA